MDFFSSTTYKNRTTLARCRSFLWTVVFSLLNQWFQDWAAVPCATVVWWVISTCCHWFHLEFSALINTKATVFSEKGSSNLVFMISVITSRASGLPIFFHSAGQKQEGAKERWQRKSTDIALLQPNSDNLMNHLGPVTIVLLIRTLMPSLRTTNCIINFPNESSRDLNRPFSKMAAENSNRSK